MATELETEKQALQKQTSAGWLSGLYAKVVGNKVADNPSTATFTTNIANAIAGISTFKRIYTLPPEDGGIHYEGHEHMRPVSTGIQNGALLDNALDQAKASGGTALEQQLAEQGMQMLARMKPWNGPVSNEEKLKWDSLADASIDWQEVSAQQTNEFGEKFKILAAHGGDPTPVYDAVLSADLKVRDLVPFSGLSGSYDFVDARDTAAVLPNLNFTLQEFGEYLRARQNLAPNSGPSPNPSV